MTLDVPVNLLELERYAAEKLDPLAYDYYRSGAGNELTLGRNRAAFEEIGLLPRVLVDVSGIETATTLLGSPASMPVAVAPTAFHKLADPEGEVATSRAAAEAGVPFCLSTLSNVPIEKVAASGGDGPRWFQLYVFRDRGLTRELVKRAEAAGYGAIVLTVDAPVLGRRERDIRNEFELPGELTIANVEAGDVIAPDGESGLAAAWAKLLDPSLTWSDLEWLVEESPLPVAVKGVHRPDDAERALEGGAAAVIVSNHGARQLDTVPATIEMLPAIADAVGDRAEVLIDGGVRRGIDVVKALALGARGVLIGRPILWGLALGGSDGARRAINLLRGELEEAMALCGTPSLADIDSELLVPGLRGRQ